MGARRKPARLRPKSLEAWAIQHRSRNSVDGETTWLEGCTDEQTRTLLFATKAAASTYIAKEHGYIARRPDLLAEPHGWTVPVPVRVTVTVALAKPSTRRIEDIKSIPARFRGLNGCETISPG